MPEIATTESADGRHKEMIKNDLPKQRLSCSVYICLILVCKHNISRNACTRTCTSSYLREDHRGAVPLGGVGPQRFPRLLPGLACFLHEGHAELELSGRGEPEGVGSQQLSGELLEGGALLLLPHLTICIFRGGRILQQGVRFKRLNTSIEDVLSHVQVQHKHVIFKLEGDKTTFKQIPDS